MRQVLVGVLTSVLLAGCGLAETGAAAGAGGTSAAEQARQGAQTEAKVRERLDAATDAAAAQRHNGEAAAE